MGYLQILSALLGLVPNAVHAIELAFPNAPGNHKLDAVTAAVSSAVVNMGAVAGQVEAIKAPLQSIISNVVDVFNSTGVFQKGPGTSNTTLSAAEVAAAAAYDAQVAQNIANDNAAAARAVLVDPVTGTPWVTQAQTDEIVAARARAVAAGH